MSRTPRPAFVFRMGGAIAIPAFCLCCLLVCAAPERAAAAPITIASYTELEDRTYTDKIGKITWLKPGAYIIRDLGNNAGFGGDFGIRDGAELKILALPGASSMTYSPLILDTGFDFYQTGGKLTILPIVDNGMAGLYLKKGDYHLSGGEMSLIGVTSTAVRLQEGHFYMTGGNISALSRSDKSVIHLQKGDFNMQGGRLVSIGANETGGPLLYAGVWLADGDFNMFGGELVAKGANGYGLYVDNDFTFTGGSVDADVENGRGIHIENGEYMQRGGTLWLSSTADQNSYAVFVAGNGGSSGPPTGLGYANFQAGAEVRPRLNLSKGEAALDTDAGHFYVQQGEIKIDPAASLNPWVDYSLGLARGEKTQNAMKFLTAENGPITGRFADPLDTLTLRYIYDDRGVSGSEKYHSLAVERKLWASEALASRNAPVARALEANRAWLLAADNLDHPLNTAYTLLDLSRSNSEISKKARGLTPWGATGLGRQAVARMDMAQMALSGVLRPESGLRPPAREPDDAQLQASESPESFVTASGPAPLWRAWATQLARYDTYDAKSSVAGDTDGWSAGATGGFARTFENGTFALGLHFIHGRQTGSGYEAESDTFGIMAGFRTTPLLSGAFRPWAELIAGYAYSDIEQRRDDIFGDRHDSDLDQHTVRFAINLGQDIGLTESLRVTPIVGFDYTFARQDDFNESAYGKEAEKMNLAVGSESMNSYRPKIGGEIEYALSEAFSFTGHAFYRYELGDRNVDLSSRYIGTPIRFTAKGEKYDRSSGNFGAGLVWELAETANVGMLYDLTVGDHYQGHQLDLTFRYAF